MFESNLKKLPNQEKSATNSKIKTAVAENHYSIIARKSKMKETAVKVFKTVRTAINGIKG